MEKKEKQYKNKDITVYWTPKLCIHATTCYKELIEVFNPGRRPWINMEGAPTKKIIQVVDKCPTKALAWEWNNRTLQSEQKTDQPQKKEGPIKTSIKVMKDGPLVVQGEFKIINPDGIELKRMSMASFCRCGCSKNMPFCDGSHRKHRFHDK